MLIIFWRDCVEVLFFIILMYKIISFLQRDTQGNLVGYCYGYMISLLVTYYCSLTALYTLLLFCLPVIAVLFIVFHQQQLQKNFVSLQRVGQELALNNNDWHDTVIRACLYAMNKNKMMICAFERSDSICLQSPVFLNGFISLELFTLIIDSPLYDQTKFVWLNQGTLRAFNAIPLWQKEMFTADQEFEQIPAWVQDALLITKKTDAIFVGIENNSRSFSIVAQGQLLEKVNSETALRLVRSYYAQAAAKRSKYESTNIQRSSNKQLQH